MASWMHLEADGSLESSSIEDMIRALMFMKRAIVKDSGQWRQLELLRAQW